MNNIKLAATNIIALVISVSEVLPVIQIISLTLACVYTSISIYLKLKK